MTPTWTSEADIQREIQKYVTDQGGICLKTHGNEFTPIGTPDLIGGMSMEHKGLLIGYFHFALEIKVPGESPTDIQTYRLQQWSKAGFITGCIHSLDEFKGGVESLRKTMLAALGQPKGAKNVRTKK